MASHAPEERCELAFEKWDPPLLGDTAETDGQTDRRTVGQSQT